MMKNSICIAATILVSVCTGVTFGQNVGFKTVNFPSADNVTITADLYSAHDLKNPFIVLCHQAGWSRGEYREIAPKLQKLGFNCLAIDQRAGKADLYNKVINQTAVAARQEGKRTEFVDAEQDIVAAIKWAKANHAKGKLVLWGSSYSAALSLRVAGQHADKIDGVMAFAPGEYFERFGKPANWIQASARKIEDPAFITSAKKEYGNWQQIYDAIPGQNKTKFLPNTPGNHGSRALYDRFQDSKAYWEQASEFLKQFSTVE